MLRFILNYILRNKPEFKSPKKLFHGGCHGCTMQNKVGTLLCPLCQYHKADWSKPNLNGSDRREKAWKRKIELISRYSEKIKLLHQIEKPAVFHGGCLDCKSQQTHGIRRCIGCRYFDANWDLPDLSMRK